MTKKASNHLRVAGWIQRNLHVTTSTLKSADLDMWEQLLSEDPNQAHSLAAYGYCRRQMTLYGPGQISEDELAEFVQEFIYKLQVAREGTEAVRLPLFEYSVRQIRLERQTV